MNEALEILRRERSDALEHIRVMRVRVRDLESAINILEGQPARIPPAGRTTGEFKASILEKLHHLSPSGASPKELADSFTREGRQTSDASVSSTLSRLKSESLVINRHGRWFAVNLSDDSALGADSVDRETTAGDAGAIETWMEVDDEAPY